MYNDADKLIEDIKHLHDKITKTNYMELFKTFRTTWQLYSFKQIKIFCFEWGRESAVEIWELIGEFQCFTELTSRGKLVYGWKWAISDSADAWSWIFLILIIKKL